MVDYPDSCVIGRSTGKVDSNGVETFTELYNGVCLLEISGQTRYDGFQFEHEPILFIPVNNVIFEINDKVTVTTWNGRVTTYTVKDWEAIYDADFPELNDTCIWLKDGTN
jgi:hypothetical protein